MIEDIKHWNGNSQFKLGYERAVNKKRWFTSAYYLNIDHYSADFIAGFKRGIKRRKLEDLVLENPT